MTRTTLIGGLAISGLLLTGCAASTAETAPSAAQVLEQGKYVERRPTTSPTEFQLAAEARTDELIAEPLTLDAALELAMLNTQSLQRVYQRYRIFNEGFVGDLAAAREAAADGDTVEWTALKVVWPTLKQEVMKDARGIPASYAIADEYVEVAQDFLEAASDVRHSYYTAVAAHQGEAMMQQVVAALRAEAELVNEQYRAGTVSRGEQSRRHLGYAEALKAHAKAKQELVEARESLARDLGLWAGTAGLILPDRLPELPSAAPSFGGLEDYALTRRLDLIEMRQAGGAWTKAVNVRSEVRESYANLLYAYDTAKYQRDVVLPLTKTVLEEAQREYSGMLIGVYDLLAEAREHIDAGKVYVETLRDYWIADGDLTQVVGGQLPEQS
jgi:outer membrane protein TolC